MVDRDDISEAVLEGDSYDEALVRTKQNFPLDLDQKIQVCILGLLWATLLAPAVWFRRDLALSLEEGATLSEVLGTRLSLLTLLGVLTVLPVGFLLLRQKYLINRRSYTVEEARDIIRVQEIYMWFGSMGIVFIFISVGLALVGLVSTDAARWLYSHTVVIYRVGEPLAVDVRATSAIGGAGALILAVGQRYLEQSD